MSSLEELVANLNAQCFAVFAQFLEYLVYPRPNFLPVTVDNISAGLVRPVILNRQMLDYCLSNILPFGNIVKMNRMARLTIDEASLKVLFESKLSRAFKAEYKTKRLGAQNWIESYALKSYVTFVRKWVHFITTDEQGNVTEIQKSKNVIKPFGLGNPTDYKFKYDSQNFIVMAMCWVLTGLNDWLDKTDVDEIDARVMTRILLPVDQPIKDFIEKVPVKSEEEMSFVQETLYEALAKHDLYPDQNSLTVLARVLINVNRVSGKLLEHVVQFSHPL
jgi:hypothetical protein